jgi:hypothetical protein
MHLSNQFKKVTGLTPTFFKNKRSEEKDPRFVIKIFFF